MGSDITKSTKKKILDFIEGVDRNQSHNAQGTEIFLKLTPEEATPDQAQAFLMDELGYRKGRGITEEKDDQRRVAFFNFGRKSLTEMVYIFINCADLSMELHVGCFY